MQDMADQYRTERPDITDGYGISDDADGLLPWSWAEERLVAERNYWIVTTSPSGAPHATPVWGAWVDGAVWFGTAPDAIKARNLRADPRLVVHLESGDETVICRGRAEQVRVGDLDRASMQRIDDAFADKYRDGETGRPFRLLAGMPSDATVWRLRPDTVLGWLETDFPRSPTRWRPAD